MNSLMISGKRWKLPEMERQSSCPLGLLWMAKWVYYPCCADAVCCVGGSFTCAGVGELPLSHAAAVLFSDLIIMYTGPFRFDYLALLCTITYTGPVEGI